ncbi:MAG: hypothetical protein KDB61_02320 [Planctomycetes bacterium]|nr:hypothetical protein [Planctomycetota bacterium]
MTDPQPPRFLLLLLLAALVAGGIWYGTGSGPEPNTAGLTSTEAPESPSNAQIQTPAQENPEPRTMVGPSEESQDHKPVGPESRRVVCLDASTGDPVAGMGLYEVERVVGPSGDDGLLEFQQYGPFSKWVLWGPGWVPQAYRPASGAEEVRLVRADASLEVALRGSTPEHRITRTLLQPRGDRSLPEGAWSAKLEAPAWDRLTAKNVPPGTYNVYVWIAEDKSAPTVYSVNGVELLAGQEKRLTIDLVADRPNTTERDS